MKKKQLAKGLVLGIMFLLIGASIIPSMSGSNKDLDIIKSRKLNSPLGRNILYVGGGGPGNYSSIQDAINDAENGDTIYVFDNSSPYLENILVNKSVNLIGEDVDSTVIDGCESGDVVQIVADFVNISGFTIKNGADGIDIDSDYNTIFENKINSNTHDGIGIYTLSNNNTIKNNNISSNNVKGIGLGYSSGNNIFGNTILMNNERGIELGYSNNNSINGNTISQTNKYGIHFFESSKNFIINNTINSNNMDGILLAYSNNNTLSLNTLSSNTYNGINFNNSKDNKIMGNTISLNEIHGIMLDYSDNNNFSENSFINDGLYVSNSFKNTVVDNSVNAKPLVYLENESSINIDDAGQVILINCNNVSLENQDLSNTDFAIYLYNTDNCLISANNINNNWYGISCSSINNTIEDNNIMYNTFGITIAGSSNMVVNNNISSNEIGIDLDGSKNIIKDNNISGNEIGIDLDGAENIVRDNNISSNDFYGMVIIDSYNSNNRLINNTISSNDDFGILLYKTNDLIISQNSFINDGLLAFNTNQITVLDNTVNGKPLVYLEDETDIVIDDAGQVILIECGNITIVGQELSNSDCGMQILKSENCTISDNNVSDNIYGIWLFESSSNLIVNNTISNCGYSGLYLSNNSFYNHIYHNNFIDNNPNGHDNGVNKWDDDYPSGGNYWSDYTGEDNDGDGIGDTPYPIEGGDNEDRYPLMEPWGTINQPPSTPKITGEIEGKKGKEYEYTITGDDPDGDEIRIIIEWGDGTNTSWLGPFQGIYDIKEKHTWTEKGSYQVRAMARDEHGAESQWGTLNVTMPKNKLFGIFFDIMNWLLERFPYIQKIVRYLLEL